MTCLPRVVVSIVACGLALTAGLLRADEPNELFKTDVFVANTDGYACYRIPALVVSKAGTLLAFCEGRKANRNDQGDIDMVLRRSKDSGRTWLPMQLVYEEGDTANIAIDNPGPVVDRETGRIWLPFCRRNSAVFTTYSDDDGLTWSPPHDITAQVLDPAWHQFAIGPGVSIILTKGPHKGRIVVPTSHRLIANDKGPKMIDKGPSYSHVFYSDDNGETWTNGQALDLPSNECQVVELGDGTLLINARNSPTTQKEPGLTLPRIIARSTDGGETWQKAEVDKTLVEPMCQGSLIRYSDASDDQRLLFSNPASPTRDHLTVRLSDDNGRTWSASRILEGEDRAAYSCLTVLPDGSIGCLYERGKEHYADHLTFANFSLEWIRSEPATP